MLKARAVPSLSISPSYHLQQSTQTEQLYYQPIKMSSQQPQQPGFFNNTTANFNMSGGWQQPQQETMAVGSSTSWRRLPGSRGTGPSQPQQAQQLSSGDPRLTAGWLARQEKTPLDWDGLVDQVFREEIRNWAVSLQQQGNGGL
jgi:hypothetical protein